MLGMENTPPQASSPSDSDSAAAQQRAEALAVLLHAARLGRTDIIKNAVQLLKSAEPGGADAGRGGKGGSAAVPDLLVSARAEPGGAGLLHIAALSGHADVVRALLHMGMPCNTIPDAGECSGLSPYKCSIGDATSAFHVYFFEQIALGNAASVSELLNSGLPATLRDGFASDDSALHWAASFGKEDVARLLLLDRTCDVDSTNAELQTALHLACKNGSKSMIALLLEYGARADLRDRQGRTPADLLPAKADGSLRELLSSHACEPAVAVAETGGGDGHVSHESRSPFAASGAAEGAVEATPEPRCPDQGPSPFIWPEPQICEFGIGSFQISLAPDPLVISIDVDVSLRVNAERALELSGLQGCLAAMGLPVSVLSNAKSATVHLCIDNILCSGIQRYVINISSTGVNLLSSDVRGLHYGLSALLQIFKFYGSTSRSGVSETRTSSNSGTEAMSPSGADFNSYGLNGATVIVPDQHDVVRQRTTFRLPCLSVEDWPDVLDRSVSISISWDSLVNIDYAVANIAYLSRCRVSRIFLSFESITSHFLGNDAPDTNDKKLLTVGSYLRQMELICRDYEIEVYPIMSVNLKEPLDQSDRFTVVSLSSYFSTRAVAVAFSVPGNPSLASRDDEDSLRRRAEAVFSSVASAGIVRAFIFCPEPIKSIVHCAANASSLRFVVAPVGDKLNQGDLMSHYNQALRSKYFGLESEVSIMGGKNSSVYLSFTTVPSFIEKIRLLAVSAIRWNSEGAKRLWNSDEADLNLKATQYIFAPSIDFEGNDRLKADSNVSLSSEQNVSPRTSSFMFWKSPASISSAAAPSAVPSSEWSKGAYANKLKVLLRFALGIHPDTKDVANTSSIALFWRFLLAPTATDFVSCAEGSSPQGDNFISSKDDAAAVLKAYRRVLAALEWKLDRRRMAQIREENASIGSAHTGGGSALVYESESLFSEINNDIAGKPFRSELRSEISLQILDVEELCISLHLICTICRIFIAGYNAAANHPSFKSLNQPLTFSELSSLLPTGSTSDAANTLLEGIEYIVSIWKKKHSRLSLRTTADGCVDVDASILMIPGLGAFQWVLAHGHPQPQPPARGQSPSHAHDLPDKAGSLVSRTLSTLLHGKL